MESWDDLMDEATVIDTPELAKDEDLDALTGFPMVITRMTFRKGVTRKGKSHYSDDHPNDAYVSLECRLHPQPDLNRINSKRKQADMTPIADLRSIPFDPGTVVVINDGSTGVYRQCVAFLASKEIITIPELPLTGEKGASALDSTPGEWTGDIAAGEVWFDEDGFKCFSIEVRLAAKSGIRPSKYTWEDRGAETRYLA
jgi:hypothetical protein